MHVYEFVIAIILVVTIGRIVERQLAAKRAAAEADPQAEVADGNRLEDLEERIKVLERIVTDQGYELRQKFRDLES